jgi:hypothetical protein
VANFAPTEYLEVIFNAMSQTGAFDWDSLMLYPSYSGAQDTNHPVLTKKSDNSVWDDTALVPLIGDVQAVNLIYPNTADPDLLPDPGTPPEGGWKFPMAPKLRISRTELHYKDEPGDPNILLPVDTVSGGG